MTFLFIKLSIQQTTRFFLVCNLFLNCHTFTSLLILIIILFLKIRYFLLFLMLILAFDLLYFLLYLYYKTWRNTYFLKITFSHFLKTIDIINISSFKIISILKYCQAIEKINQFMILIYYIKYDLPFSCNILALFIFLSN